MGNRVPENKPKRIGSSKVISHLMKNLLDNIYHVDFGNYDKSKIKQDNLNAKQILLKNDSTKTINGLNSKHTMTSKIIPNLKSKVPICPVVVPKISLQSKKDPLTSRESLKLLMNNIISIYTNNLATTGPAACPKKRGFKGLIIKLVVGFGAIYGSSQIGLWGSQQDSQNLIDKMKALLENKDNEKTRQIKADIRASIDNSWNSFIESFSFVPAAFGGITSKFGGVKKQICGEEDPKTPQPKKK